MSIKNQAVFCQQIGAIQLTSSFVARNYLVQFRIRWEKYQNLVSGRSYAIIARSRWISLYTCVISGTFFNSILHYPILSSEKIGVSRKH